MEEQKRQSINDQIPPEPRPHKKKFIKKVISGPFKENETIVLKGIVYHVRGCHDGLLILKEIGTIEEPKESSPPDVESPTG